jgi:hypothetical protein
VLFEGARGSIAKQAIERRLFNQHCLNLRRANPVGRLGSWA